MDPLDIVTIDPSDSPRLHPKRKQWCFTLHHNDDLRIPDELPSSCSYLVFQQEVCPDTQRTHLQGFACFNQQLRFSEAKVRLQSVFATTRSPYLQYIRGSVDDNIRYCTKVESRRPGTQHVELGERPARSGTGRKSGKSTALVRDLILARKSPVQVLQDETLTDAWSSAFRLARTWNSLLGELILDRDPMVDPTVIVFYGPSRTGKTRLAHELFPNAYVKPTGKWWDLYTGQTEVIYDDFDGSDMTFSQWKTIFDRYKCLVEPKGGMSRLASTTHVVTTNVYPSHWWSKRVTQTYGRDAIWSRITQLWDFHTTPACVWEEPLQFRALSSNFSLELEDPKARPE